MARYVDPQMTYTAAKASRIEPRLGAALAAEREFAEAKADAVVAMARNLSAHSRHGSCLTAHGTRPACHALAMGDPGVDEDRRGKGAMSGVGRMSDAGRGARPSRSSS